MVQVPHHRRPSRSGSGEALNTIARALIEQTLRLEHSEGSLDEDDIVTMVDDLAERLEDCTPEEVGVLRQTLEELMAMESKSARPRLAVIEFYRKFLSNVGLGK